MGSPITDPTNGGGGGGKITLWNILNLDPVGGVDMAQALTRPACAPFTRNEEGDEAECANQAAQEIAGSPATKFMNAYPGTANPPRCYSYRSTRPSWDVEPATTFKPNSPCIAAQERRERMPADFWTSTGNWSAQEIHDSIPFLRSPTQSNAISIEGNPIALMVRVWRIRVNPDAVSLPARTKAAPDGTQDPRYPVFERRMNLGPSVERGDEDARSDAGDVPGPGNGSVPQEVWWRGGPNFNPLAQTSPARRDSAERELGEGDNLGSWWLNVSRAGPLGAPQTTEVDALCYTRYRNYRSRIFNYPGNAPVRGDLDGALRLSETLKDYAGKMQDHCIFDWRDQAVSTGQPEPWFPYTRTKNGETQTLWAQESIALGWSIDPTTPTPTKVRFGQMKYVIQAPPGYMYAIHTALIDGREQILSSMVKFAIPGGGTTMNCEEQLAQSGGQGSCAPSMLRPPDPEISVMAPRTIPTGSENDGVSPTQRMELSASFTPAGPGSGPAAPDSGQSELQQAWFHNTTALWWAEWQQLQPEGSWSERWLNRDFLMIKEGNSVIPTEPWNVSDTAGATWRPVLRDTAEGKALGNTRPVVYRAEDSRLVGATETGPNRKVSNAVPVMDPNIARRIETRSFKVASSEPSPRTAAGKTSPLEFSGTADSERARWVETPFTKDDLAAWNAIGGKDAWERRCDHPSAVNPCIGPLDLRLPGRQQPVQPWGGDEQLAGAFFRQTLTGFFQVRLNAANPAAIRALTLQRRDDANPVRSLYTEEFQGPGVPGAQARTRNVVGQHGNPNEWSITFCRSGEHPGVMMANRSKSLGEDDDRWTEMVPKEEFGDQGCQADYYRWSWDLKSAVRCADGAPGCINKDYADYCTTAPDPNVFYSPTRKPGPFLTNQDVAKPLPAGDQAVMHAPTPSGQDVLPWQAPRPGCYVPGSWWQGRFLRDRVDVFYKCERLSDGKDAVNRFPAGSEGARLYPAGRGYEDCLNNPDLAGDWRPISVMSVEPYYRFDPHGANADCPTIRGYAPNPEKPVGSRGCFYPGMPNETLMDYYRAYYRDGDVVRADGSRERATRVDLYVRECTRRDADGDCTRWGWSDAPPNRETIATHSDGVDLVNVGAPTNRIYFQTDDKWMPNVVRTPGGGPVIAEDRRAGSRKFGAVMGWSNYTPRQAHCRTGRNHDGDPVSVEGKGNLDDRCPRIDIQHAGRRLKAGDYFLSGVMRANAGSWTYTASQFHPRGTNWQWTSDQQWALPTPAETTFLGLQPSR